jgi:hypothetical protein
MLGPRRKDGKQRATSRTWAVSSNQHLHDNFSTFAIFVQSQDEYIRKILQHADLSDETATAIAAQVDGDTPLYCGTDDGGLLNGLGTFGYVWANGLGSEILMQGKIQVPGHVYGMSSTRTELCGIFAALVHLRMVATYHHLVVPSKTGKLCTVYCDSKVALQQFMISPMSASERRGDVAQIMI